jgi:hypothetical protein
MIIIIGLLFLTGWIIPEGTPDLAMFRVMGAVFILFGIYRLVTYHTQLKRYDFSRKDDDE